MTFEVNLDISAEQDIDEIFKWYEKQREGLGFEFLLSFDDSLDLLAKNPFAYFNVTRTIRRIAITRFPYTAYYSIDLNTNDPCYYASTPRPRRMANENIGLY